MFFYQNGSILQEIAITVFVYPIKPIRFGTCWMVKNDYNYYYVLRDMYGNIFDFIKWDDEEPWSIEDLKKLEVKDE